MSARLHTSQCGNIESGWEHSQHTVTDHWVSDCTLLSGQVTSQTLQASMCNTVCVTQWLNWAHKHYHTQGYNTLELQTQSLCKLWKFLWKLGNLPLSPSVHTVNYGSALVATVNSKNIYKHFWKLGTIPFQFENWGQNTLQELLKMFEFECIWIWISCDRANISPLCLK